MRTPKPRSISRSDAVPRQTGFPSPAFSADSRPLSLTPVAQAVVTDDLPGPPSATVRRSAPHHGCAGVMTQHGIFGRGRDLGAGGTSQAHLGAPGRQPMQPLTVEETDETYADWSGSPPLPTASSGRSHQLEPRLAAAKPMNHAGQQTPGRLFLASEIRLRQGRGNAVSASSTACSPGAAPMRLWRIWPFADLSGRGRLARLAPPARWHSKTAGNGYYRRPRRGAAPHVFVVHAGGRSTSCPTIFQLLPRSIDAETRIAFETVERRQHLKGWVAGFSATRAAGDQLPRLGTALLQVCARHPRQSFRFHFQLPAQSRCTRTMRSRDQDRGGSSTPFDRRRLRKGFRSAETPSAPAPSAARARPAVLVHPADEGRRPEELRSELRPDPVDEGDVERLHP